MLIFWFGVKQVVKDFELVVFQTVTKRHCLRKKMSLGLLFVFLFCTGRFKDFRNFCLVIH